MFLTELQHLLHHHSAVILEQASIARTIAQIQLREIYDQEDAGKSVDRTVMMDTAAEALDDLARHITKDIFPFFTIPSELRNKIYRFCLLSSYPFTNLITAANKAYPLNILIINKQAYCEGSPMFYSQNHFRFDKGYPGIPSTYPPCRSRNPYAKSMNHFSIGYPRFRYDDASKRIDLLTPGCNGVVIFENIYTWYTKLEVLELHIPFHSATAMYDELFGRYFDIEKATLSQCIMKIGKKERRVLGFLRSV